MSNHCALFASQFAPEAWIRDPGTQDTYLLARCRWLPARRSERTVAAERVGDKGAQLAHVLVGDRAKRNDIGHRLAS